MQLELASPIRSLARDTELVARAQRGELRAFEELIRARLDKLFRTACGILRDLYGPIAGIEAPGCLWVPTIYGNELWRIDL